MQRSGLAIAITPPARTIKILQVTDLHLTSFLPLDKLWMRDVRNLATMHEADLVIVTGDMFGLRKERSMVRTLKAFDDVVGKHVKWTFAWGNHDQELHGKYGDPRETLDAVEACLERLPNCLYVATRKAMEEWNGGRDPSSDDGEKDAWAPLHDGSIPVQKWDGFHGGNFRIAVHDPDTRAVKWNLFILNSRRQFHLPPNVTRWMETVVSRNKERLPCICFYHVPNHEYHDIWERGIAKGIKRESVCFERDRGRVHGFLTSLGTVKAVFVGHDHVNDYHGVLDGIDYVYGRKTCLGGYGSFKVVPEKFAVTGKAIKIGGKLITLSLDQPDPMDNLVTHVSVFMDGTTWNYGD